jgi:hypothetical protein
MTSADVPLCLLDRNLPYCGQPWHQPAGSVWIAHHLFVEAGLSGFAGVCRSSSFGLAVQVVIACASFVVQL